MNGTRPYQKNFCKALKKTRPDTFQTMVQNNAVIPDKNTDVQNNPHCPENSM